MPKDTSQYIATMEASYRAKENQLFYNLSNTAFPRTSVAGYPVDYTVTNPNDSVVKLNGNGPKTGPGIILKVMTGDKIDVGVQYYYNSMVNNNPSNLSASDLLSSLATGIISLTGAAHGSLADLNTTTGPLFGALTSFISSNNPTVSGKPQAYLNWILLDDQFRYVSSYPQSGALLVGASGTQSGGTLQAPLGYTGIPITKSGYLYVYISNATPGWDVFFDNLSVKQYSGPMLEENHYYPYGLAMAGISDKALKTQYPENKYRYNGKELQSQEFSDGAGLEEYDFGARMQDPQLGIWHNLDPLADKNRKWSPYTFTNDNPIRFMDPDGMEAQDNQGGNDGEEKVNIIKVKDIKTGNITTVIVGKAGENAEVNYHDESDDPKTTIGQIRAAFNDGKQADHYEISVRVKEPVPGCRNCKLGPHLGTNPVGHSYIVLTKVNTDQSTVIRTFGYFPDGGGGDAVDPMAKSSTFRDNTGHDWDAGVHKTITEKEFNNILNIAAAFESRSYNLVTNNCTTFAAAAAQAARIDIKNSIGGIPIITVFGGGFYMIRWFKGYNPASMGESLRHEDFTPYHNGELEDYQARGEHNH